MAKPIGYFTGIDTRSITLNHETAVKTVEICVSLLKAKNQTQRVKATKNLAGLYDWDIVNSITNRPPGAIKWALQFVEDN